MKADKRTACQIKQYASLVTKGIIPAGKFVKQACQRHLTDLQEGKKRGLHFDRDAAAHAIYHIQLFRHSKGEWGGRTIVLSDWQIFIVGCIFGWKRLDGTRRFREIYIEIARKNGKSTLLAAICLYMLFFDREPGAEVYAAATKEDQAKIIFDEAVNMVQQLPRNWKIRRHTEIVKKCISVQSTMSRMRPLGADSHTLDGLNPHMCAIDELHAHKTRDVFDVLDTAIGARRQPLLLSITTAGYNKHSICYEKHAYSEHVLNNIVGDDAFFCFIAALDEKDDWKNPEVWGKANPNLGISVKMDDLARQCEAAKAMPAAQNTFKQKRLNIWTQQSDRWLDAEVWAACKADYTADDLKRRPCFGGLDLASTLDLSSFSLVFPPQAENEPWKNLTWFWMPGENIRQRVEKNRVPYDVWTRNGLIRTTEGNTIDYNFIERDILKICEDFLVKGIAFDRMFATQIVTNLGSHGLEMLKFGQGFYSMAAPTRFLGELIASKRMAHNNNSVMNWMADNMVVEQDAAGNLKPDKSSAMEKIDGIVSMIMGIGIAIVTPEEAGSYTANHGIMVV